MHMVELKFNNSSSAHICLEVSTQCLQKVLKQYFTLPHKAI